VHCPLLGPRVRLERLGQVEEQAREALRIAGGSYSPRHGDAHTLVVLALLGEKLTEGFLRARIEDALLGSEVRRQLDDERLEVTLAVIGLRFEDRQSLLYLPVLLPEHRSRHHRSGRLSQGLDQPPRCPHTSPEGSTPPRATWDPVPLPCRTIETQRPRGGRRTAISPS